MTFSSITFFIFFFIVLMVLSFTNLRMLHNRFDIETIKHARHCFLLVASYFFYSWWDVRFSALMILLTVVAFFTAKSLEGNKTNKVARIIGIALPLIILGFFKYYNFFIESFTDAFGIKHDGTLNIILPVGISFYTFQALSYTIDVYRGKIKPTNSFIKLALYIAFFPQLVAGPIVKAEDFMPQLEENRNVSVGNFMEGVQIFLFGLAKKVVISDNISIFVDNVFEMPKAFHSFTVIFAVVAYSIQIYLDFSGYSDMAVGCAKCMGYNLCRNFNVPYISKNLTEFWKRWHISLSSWLQEYLYISLGGNRKGRIRTYVNLLITMLLGGLWHGASWTFVIWGGLHGLGLCVHKLFLSLKQTKHSGNIFISGICIISTYIYVCICWVFFRSDTLQTAIVILNRMFSWSEGIIQIFSWNVVAILTIIFGTIGAYVHGKHAVRDKTLRKIGIAEGFYPVLNLNKYVSLVIFFIEIGVILGLAYTGNNPFIYFQF